MKEITREDYKAFIKNHEKIMIEDTEIILGKAKNNKGLQPKNFEQESETVWSFPDRGEWATHKGNYRGNWSPYIPRNVILRYSKPEDLVLDQMVGSGTTLVECKLTGRNGIGADINPDAIMVTRDRLNFNYTPLDPSFPKTTQRTYIGDARNLDLIKDNEIDLIATHPPYGFIIPYSNHRVEGDLSNLRNVDDFVKEMRKVAQESFRVLKENGHCAILIGDTRKHQHYIPIAFRTMQSFLDVGFILREDVIKRQWKTKTTRERWRGKYNFLKIAHEHLFIFRKPKEDEQVSKFKNSTKWW
jgi:DNA modification methylase